MKIKSPVLTKAAGLLGASLIRAWMGTLEYKAACYDPSGDPRHPAFEGQKILVFWHEYILAPIAPLAHSDVAVLLSNHRDAEILSRIAFHNGFDVVRGSSTRGGMAALRELLRHSGQMNLAITPDGPRGPRRVLAQGPIWLASKLGLPLVAGGFGFDRPWRLKSWDRFAIPRPFSRARAVASPPIYIPPDLDRAGVEHYRIKVERLLNRLTQEAEIWAESAARRAGEYSIWPAGETLSRTGIRAA